MRKYLSGDMLDFDLPVPIQHGGFHGKKELQAAGE